MSLEAQVHREWIRGLVMRKITCGMTGKVLDVRNLIVFRDSDGDPVDVAHPDALDMLSTPTVKSALEKASWTMEEYHG